jgi:hypothetical protein
MKNKKKQLPTDPRKKKTRAHHQECMLSLPIGSMKFLCPKLFMAIFGLGLMAASVIWGHSLG